MKYWALLYRVRGSATVWSIGGTLLSLTPTRLDDSNKPGRNFPAYYLPKCMFHSICSVFRNNPRIRITKAAHLLGQDTVHKNKTGPLHFFTQIPAGCPGCNLDPVPSGRVRPSVTITCSLMSLSPPGPPVNPICWQFSSKPRLQGVKNSYINWP